METPTPTARYETLRDYLRVLRRYRVVIVLIGAIGAAAGVVTAKQETPVYQATSVVSFQDPTQGLSFVGFTSNTTEPPAQLAGENAETVTRPEVMAQVKRTLGTPLSVSSLEGAVSGQVSTAGLLDVTASSSTPGFAAQLANAAASVLVDQANRTTQIQFAQVGQGLQRQIAHLNARGATGQVASVELPFYEQELVRLETVSKFARSATVEKIAQPPGSAVSPKTVRSGLIGLALGLLLAIGIAFFRDSLDRRLRTLSDIESSFRLPVIGHVREKLLGQIAHTANGASDHAVDLEAFRILRRNLEFLDRDRSTRTVVVTSALPEEGKTTVAGSLAFAMAQAGRRTLLVDCDFRRPALASRLRVESSPGMSDFLEGNATPEQILRTVQFSDPPASRRSTNGASAETTNHSLVLIPAGSPTSHAAELLGSSRFKDFLEEASAVYEIIVIDSSPLLPVADTLEMLPHVEGLIVCARERQTTRDEAFAARTALSRFPERPAGVVVTGVDSRHNEDPAYAYTHAYS